ACCRQVWDLLTDERSRKAVELGEDYVDGRVGKDELELVHYAAHDARVAQEPETAQWEGGVLAALAAEEVADPTTTGWAWESRYVWYQTANATGAKREDELKRRANLLRDITGNPFRPVAIRPDWLTWNNGTVPKIAQHIYDERRFDL